MHAYIRAIEPGREDDSLSRIADLVPAGARVLDVGTGSGALGAYLSTQKSCVVDGITGNPDEAAMAQAHYRMIWVCDLDQTLPEVVRQNCYDVVVCADVLEHLREPAALLRALRNCLESDGQVLLSVPNVTYLGVRLNLLAGRFVRTQEGLLDATHLHFWDRDGLVALCQASGYRLADTGAVWRELVATEFAAFDVLALPPSVRAYVCAGPDASIYQFLWTLVPATEGDVTTQVTAPPALPKTDATPHFVAEVHWDCGDGFRADSRTAALGRMQEGLQTLAFELPPKGVQAMRLDVADRPGIVELVRVTARNTRGEPVWQWNPGDVPVGPQNACEWVGTHGPNGGRVLDASGSDPWFVISVPAGALAGASCVEIEQTCPMPYARVAFDAANRDKVLLRQQLEATIERLGAELKQRMQELATLSQQAADQRVEHEAWAQRAHQQLNTLQAQLGAIHASRAWRLLQAVRRLLIRLHLWT